MACIFIVMRPPWLTALSLQLRLAHFGRVPVPNQRILHGDNGNGGPRHVLRFHGTGVHPGELQVSELKG